MYFLNNVDMLWIYESFSSLSYFSVFCFFFENNVDDNDKQANNRFFCQKQQEIFIEICISLGFLFLAPFFSLAIYFCS